jgi:hypothetical protein
LVDLLDFVVGFFETTLLEVVDGTWLSPGARSIMLSCLASGLAGVPPLLSVFFADDAGVLLAVAFFAGWLRGALSEAGLAGDFFTAGLAGAFF